MKKINIIIVMICLYPSLVFADINTLFNMDMYERKLSLNTNTGIYSNELFIEQTALGGFNYIKINL